ncbi:hypothetical protein SBRCBS47491_001136 [Sporothrix bragantina]|uniref:F-box domain-containing protein n=1 Tax=Sporothrix bragantina TaxID=671064 RepID=A0ABP0AW11_9PEZI
MEPATLTISRKRALTMDQSTTAPASTATVVQREIRKSMRVGNRLVKRDVERGYLTALQMRDAMHERRLLYEDWHKHKSEDFDRGKGSDTKEPSNKYNKLDEEWLARNTRRPGFLSFPDGKLNDDDDECITRIYTQSVANARSSDSSSQRSLTACAPGTILPWTKYYKTVEIIPCQHEDATNTLASLSIQSTKAKPNLSPIKIPLPLLPAPKRLLISRSVSLGQSNAGRDDNDDNNNNNNDEDAVYQALKMVPCISQTQSTPLTPDAAAKAKFDLISSISSCPEIVMQVCKYLNLGDVLTLYRTSRVFKSTFDSDQEQNVQRMARQFASAETRSVFSWRRVTKTISPLSYMGIEPQSPWAREFQGRSPQVPMAPTLRYVGMLASRERKVRDIVAMLARAGHRLPRTSATATLKKMWLLMDIPTNGGRVLVLKDKELFTDLDLLTMQMFHVKLVLHFHDPLMGPDHSLAEAHGDPAPGAVPSLPDHLAHLTVSDFLGDSDHSRNDEVAAAAAAREYVIQHQRQLPEHSLVETLLGQRGGLDVLWNMLRGKAYRTLPEVVALKARYDCRPPTFLGHDSTGSEHTEHDNNLDSFTFDFDPGSNWGSLFQTGQGLESLGNIHTESSHSGLSSSTETSPHHDSSYLPDDILFVQDDHLVDILGTRIPHSQMGKDHLEGWGKGSQHLLRPDELVALEAARRVQENPDEHMDLSSHVPFMAIWGNRDFATGDNLLPDMDEMYISDDEHDVFGLDELSSDDGEAVEDSHENKENMGVPIAGHSAPVGPPGSPLNKETAAIAALVAKGVDEDMYPMSEHRLQSQCGNVLVDRDAWQPWQVLKMRWATLTLPEKIDVWWVSHQFRLHKQAWTQREGQDRRASHGNSGNQNGQNNQASEGNQTDPTGLSQISYMQLNAMPNEEAQNGADDVDMGMDTEADEYDDQDYFAGDEEEDGQDDEDSDVDDYQAPPSHNGSSQPSTPSNAQDPSAPQLSRRHQKLVQSCVQWALREQDEVDEALLAQADMPYEAEELDHWDEFLAEASQILAGLDIDSLDNEINEEGWLSEEHMPVTPMPNPEEVLVPEFGGLDDVIRLVEQVYEAQADVDAAEMMIRLDGPVPGTTAYAAAGQRVAKCKDMVQDLTAKLELLLQAEVFAVEM